MRLKKKTTPAKALQDMPGIRTMSTEFHQVYKVYYKALDKEVDGLPKTSRGYKKLKNTAEAQKLANLWQFD